MANIRYKEAIGLEVKKGKVAIGRKPNKEELEKLYIKESKSIRKIANILGCSKDMVYRSLKEYQIETMPKTRRSQLSAYESDYLKGEINSKGYKKTAKDLGVDVSTLRRYLKKIITV